MWQQNNRFFGNPANIKGYIIPWYYKFYFAFTTG